MKSTPRILVAALIAAIALPASALAAKADKKKNAPATETFASVDKNSDGNITVEEFLATQKDKLGEEAAKTRFATLDKNKDGKLTKDEFGGGDEPAEKKKRKKKKDAN
ncbi:MAG: EF-hand domain-containing protein [Opitutaceae bacterium]|nr:EF-hand domain-containing protein [Opitutaceae bacterium]